MKSAQKGRPDLRLPREVKLSSPVRGLMEWLPGHAGVELVRPKLGWS